LMASPAAMVPADPMAETKPRTRGPAPGRPRARPWPCSGNGSE
jgi:hypothetical protein